MIGDLNKVLEELFKTQVEGLKKPPPLPPTVDDQITFQPPDPDWRGRVENLGNSRLGLNVYLVDLQENRKLRSNERKKTQKNGIAYEELAPHRIDCHYLISAWSPDNNPDDRTNVEHSLIYETLEVLMRFSPLNPSQVYASNPPGLQQIDEQIRDTNLPMQILPQEGFPKLAEFWGTMGMNYRWKPIIYLIVTLPVAKPKRMAGPPVTTRITEYHFQGNKTDKEVWIQIGGWVLDTLTPLPNGKPTPVSGAWVQLQQTNGTPLKDTKTDGQGRFSFGELKPGQYQLNWRAVGHPVPAAPRVIEVPSKTGEYDLKFT